MNKLNPYDLWKSQTDLANKYRDSYVHKKQTIMWLSTALLVSVACNIYIINSVC